MADHKKIRHILGISGGKDSAALAVYMRDKVQEMEYFFCDTGVELSETYDYLHQLEKYLGKTIQRLNPEQPFDYRLNLNGNFLPSPRQRWCTIELKLKPLERFVGRDEAVSYVAIRADEDNRKGYISPKDNIKAVYPFKEAGIKKAGVYKILEDAGLGLPKYYEWRTRSGCYFCFFQRKYEWIGLKENHPDLFEKAKQYEKYDAKTGKRYIWNQDESLEEMSRPERVEEIKVRHTQKMEKELETFRKAEKPLYQVFEEVLEEDDNETPCLICNL